MALLSDIPKVLRTVGPWTFVKRIHHEVHDDNILAWAAALAYSWLFAVFPFMIFLLSLLPFLPEEAKAEAQEQINAYVRASLPAQGADTILRNLEMIMARPRGGLIGLGLLLTLWGASGGMNMTISALDRCYDLDRGRPFYRQRPLAVLLTIVTAGLLILLVVLLPIGTIAIKWIEQQGAGYVSGPLLWTWKVMRYPLAVLMAFTVVHVVYHWGPNIRQRFSFLSPGAVFCVAVWIGQGLLFRLYVERFGKYNETYGTVGGVAVLLLFFYVDAVVLLVGAEINSEVDFAVLGVPRGTRDFRTPAAVKAATAAAAAQASAEAQAAEGPGDQRAAAAPCLPADDDAAP